MLRGLTKVLGLAGCSCLFAACSAFGDDVPSGGSQGPSGGSEKIARTQERLGTPADVIFRITGVKTGALSHDDFSDALYLVTSWDNPPLQDARVFACGGAFAPTFGDLPCTDGQPTGKFHVYPNYLSLPSIGILASILNQERYIRKTVVDLSDLTAELVVDLDVHDSPDTQHGRFTIDIDLVDRSFSPRIGSNSGAVCAFRHNGVAIGPPSCTSNDPCGGPAEPACDEQCALLSYGWELCYDVKVCSANDATCDNFDDDCDGEVDEDVPTTVISCQDGSACRAMGTRVCQEGAFVDQCSPAPVIDFSGANCPTIPASTFTTEGMSDTDSDGIPDLWETNGFDANCDGDVTDAVDLPFHVWGANPLHKDLFFEFDWMTGEEPRRANIQAIKDAFANAPVDAGGTSNPDGLPGINLFVDTGALVDPVSGAAVGDNLGGGNAMAVQYFSRLDGRFMAAKCANFNPIRERFFRYGISAPRGCLNPAATEDGGGPGSCQNLTATGTPVDDSSDGQDANDPDCQAGGSGFEDGSTDTTSCTDSKDNGADGVANCADPDCHYDPGADEGDGPNTCSNEMDDDGDNKIDRADEDHCHYANGYGGGSNLLDHTHFGIVIMHELGHILGLGHGGPDKLSNGDDFPGDAQDRKPNHLSIMHNGNWPGIRLRTSEDASLVANSCFDGIDNGGTGDGIDIGDTNCQVGQDVWGPGGLPDGIPDGVILDYSPPRRTDGSRVQLPNLDETNLSEAVGLDPLDSRNLFMYVGYDPKRLEDGKNTCGDGNDNGGDGPADNLDTDCFIGTVFVAELPEDNVSSCADGIDNGDGDGVDQADRTSDCRRVFINAVDGDNDGNGSPDALAIDWQLDNLLTPPPVKVDINGFWDLAAFWDPEENLLGADDWRNLKIRPAGLGGAQTVQVFREPTILEVDAQLRHERGTDLGVSFDALPTGIGLGQPTPVRVTVVNLGPRRAAEYRAVLHLPPGVTLDDPNCSQAGSRVECPGSNLGMRDADVFTVTIRIGPNPVSAVRTLGAEVEVVDAENLNAANNLFGRILVEPSGSECGDGIVNVSSGELCDDGNQVDTDGCRSSCVPATCGDGVVQQDVEACDTGGASPTCNADCSQPPNIWNPTNLSAVAWYFASPGDVVLDSGTVSQWSDRSGNGRHIANANFFGRPTYSATGWNSAQPTVTFNSKLLFREPWEGPPGGDDGAFTVLAVMRSALSHTGAVAAWWDVNGGGNVWCHVKPAHGGETVLETTRLDYLTRAQILRGSQDLGTGRHVVAWRFSPEELRVTVDATTTRLPLDSIGAITTGTFLLGSSSLFGTHLFQGDISELVVVPRGLSDFEVEQFRDYARQVWGGLPASDDPPDPCSDASGQPSLSSKACDDGNPATYGDRCQAGACVGTVPLPGSPAEHAPVAWFVASSSEVTLDTGSLVSQWFDRSGQGRHVMQGHPQYKPSFVATGWNESEPTVTFTNTALRKNSWSGSPGGDDSSFTVLAVMRSAQAQNGGPAGWGAFDGYSSVRPELQNVAGETRPFLMRADDFSNQSFSMATDLMTERHVVAWRYSPEVMKLTVDGSTVTSSSLASINPLYLDTFLIGVNNPLGFNLFHGDISELAVLPSSISDEAVAEFRSYAQATWGGLP
jgi:cysteine-rich repeat protein